MNKASEMQGHAAARAEGRKNTKNSKKLPDGASRDCMPLVFEQFGNWGKKASENLEKLAQTSRAEDGYVNAAEFRHHWGTRLSMSLQR